MKKKDPRTPLLGIASMSLVVLSGILGILPRERALEPVQLAWLGLMVAALLGINFSAYRLYRYCQSLLELDRSSSA
jgi:hypothetical protein